MFSLLPPPKKKSKKRMVGAVAPMFSTTSTTSKNQGKATAVSILEDAKNTTTKVSKKTPVAALFAPRAVSRKKPTKQLNSTRKHTPTVAPTLEQTHANAPTLTTLASSFATPAAAPNPSTSSDTTDNDRSGMDDSFTCKPEEEYNPMQPNEYEPLAAELKLQLQLAERDTKEKVARKTTPSNRVTGRGRDISNVPAWMSNK